MRKQFAMAFAASAMAGASFAQHPAPPSPAFAAPNLTPQGVAAMAANCAMCHGQRGYAVAGSSMPSLGGQAAAGFVEQMTAFREGRREGSVMPQIAKGFTDAEIAAMGAYFAQQRRRP